MIAYRIGRAQLEQLIEGAVPGWLARAAQRTAGFASAGKYRERDSIWSEVKPVYMQLQGGEKCIYCERKLESSELGKGEQDVEHFRPKGNVRAWKVPASLTNAGVTVKPPLAGAGGYYFLPYDIFNYGASCKPCNSALKKDYFPIAGAYKLNGKRPEGLLASERPLLLYPIGDFDDDPEALIHFYGVSPQPKAAAGFPRHRALTTIEFFRLDDVAKRKNLFRERALILVAVHPQLEALASNPRNASAKDIITCATSSKNPHANCARSFVALHEKDRASALTIFQDAVRYLMSTS